MGLFDKLFKKKPAEVPEKDDFDLPRVQKAKQYKEVVTYSYKTEKFLSDGGPEFHEAIKSFAEENPDYDLSKKELLEQYDVGDIIHQWDFRPAKPGAKVLDDGSVVMTLDDKVVGKVKKGKTSRARNLIQGPDVEKITVFLSGGETKFVNEDEDTGKLYINEGGDPNIFTATMMIKYRIPNKEMVEVKE
jgi:hypothetical protein